MTRQPYATVPLTTLHIPVISETKDAGVWGVYCFACSQREQDYVYPCDRGRWLVRPPTRLVEQ